MATDGKEILFGGARSSNPFGLSKLESKYKMFMHSEHNECLWLSPTKEAAESAKSRLEKLPLIEVGEIKEEEESLFTFVVTKLKARG